MKMSYDIAIVGAGIAGSALACSLAMTADAMDKPLRIALIEAQAISDSYPCCEDCLLYTSDAADE